MRRLIQMANAPAGLSLAFLALALLPGCSKDGAGEKPHAAAVSLEAPAPAPGEDKSLKALDADPKLATVALSYRNRFATAKELDTESTSIERLRQIAASLAPAILRKEYVRNPRLQGDDAFATSLGFFNESILKLARRDRAMLDGTGVLRDYENFVFENCPDSLSNCRNLPFFATDSGSAAVLLLVAEEAEKDVERLRAEKGAPYLEAARRLLKLYRTIYVVFNASFNNDYYLRYVKYNADVEAYITSLTSRERKERDQDLRQHQQFLNTALVLLRAQKDEKSRAAYCDFVLAQQPFRYNMTTSKQGGAQGIRQIISQYIGCANERGVLEANIRDYLVSEREAQTKAEIKNTAKIEDFSYYYALKYLKMTPEVLENLAIKDDQRADLAFFILDRLFYEAIDQKLAAEYWQQIRKIDDLSLLDFAENYVKVQTAYTLKATHAIVAKVIADEYKKEGLSGDLYTRIVDKVNQGTQFEWDTLKTRIGFLRNFLTPIFDDRIARAGSGATKEAVDKYNALKDKFEALADHLNYVATSPIMLVMSYYMSKAPGQIKIFVSWWTGTNQWLNIDGSDALKRFFEVQANWIRFFSYGTKDFVFDEHQLKHVFDFSLRSGLFDTIPFGIMTEDKPHMKVEGAPTLNSEWLFFRQYTEAMLQRELTSAQRQVDDVEKILRNQEFVDRFNSFCDDPLATPLRLTLSQVSSSAFLNDAALKADIAKIYELHNRLNNMNREIKQVEDLRMILKQHFFADGAEKRLSKEKFAKRGEILGLIDGELEKYYRSERELLRRIFNADAMLTRPGRNCFLRMHKAELFRANTIYRANIDTYKDVHAAVTLIRLLPEGLKLEDLPEAERANPSAALEGLAQKAVNEWQSSPDAKAMGAASAADVSARMLRNASLSFSQTVWQSLLDRPASEFKEQTLGAQAVLALSGRFQPHNLKPVFAKVDGTELEYGVYVDGIENYSLAGNPLTAKSDLTRKGYRHGKRDTLFRIRRQLQVLEVDAQEAAAYIGIKTESTGKIPLAGGLEIPIGTFAEIANDGLFTSNDLATVGWVPDQTAFVKDAMSQLAGDNRGGNQFLSWHSSADTYGIKMLRTRYTFLKELFDKGPREVSEAQTRQCKVDEWFDPVATPENPDCKISEVSLDTLLYAVMERLELFRIDAEERDMSEWIGLPGRYHADAESFFYLTDKESAADWIYFERFYKLNFVGTETARADGKPLIADRIESSGALESFQDSMRLRVRPDRHLFPMRSYVTQFERNRLRKPLVRQVKRATAFEERIRDLEDSVLQDPSKALGNFIFERVRNVRTDSRYMENDFRTVSDKGNWRFISVNDRKDGDRAGTPIYLRDDVDSAQVWFRKALQGFHVTELKCQVMASPGDPDYDLLPQAGRQEIEKFKDCHERYEAYQKVMDAERLKARDARRAQR